MSKQADKAERLPLMNLGVELPEFDDNEYPGGGYGLIKDFGWTIRETQPYERSTRPVRIIHFEDLPSATKDSHYLEEDDIDRLSTPEPGEEYIFNQPDDWDYMIIGYQDGELRFGIIRDDQMDYDYFLANNLFAIDIHSDYLRWHNGGDDSWFGEFQKDYIQQQVQAVAKDGVFKPEDFLRIYLFREYVANPIMENIVNKVCNEDLYVVSDGISYKSFHEVAINIWIYSCIEELDEDSLDDDILKKYHQFTAEVCSKHGLRQIANHLMENLSYLLRYVFKDDLLKVNPPQGLSNLCARLLAPDHNEIVYNPFAALGDIATALPENEVHGEESDTFISFISDAYDFNYDRNVSSLVEHVDPLTTLRDTNRTFHYIASVLPLGMKDKDCAEVLGLALDQLDEEGGHLVCALPSSFTSAKEYRSLRKRLVDGDYEVTIISLPPLYQPYSSVTPCVVDVKSSYKRLRLVDGTGFAHRSYSSRIKFLSESLLEAISAQTEVVIDLEPEMVHNYMLDPAWNIALNHLPDLKDGWQYLSLDKLTSRAKPEDVEAILISQHLPISAVIDSATPTRGHFALLPDEEMVLPDYLLHELNEEYVQRQASALAHGITGARINRRDLLKIRIAVPPIEEQHKLLNVALKKDVEEKAEMIRRQYEQFEKEIHIRKHAIVQCLSSLHSRWNTLNNYRLRNGGNILADDTVGQLNPVPVRQVFDTINTYLEVCLTQAEHLADSQYDWGEPADIDPVAFIRDYVSNRLTDSFRMYVSCEKDHKMRIHMPHRALRQVIDNVVKNAQAHGFTNPTRDDYSIHFDMGIEGDWVVMRVANNGTPLASDLQTDMVFSFGYSSALNQSYSIDGTTAVHSGIGGDEIRSILHKFGGTADIESLDPKVNDGYTVLYTIKLKNMI